MLCIKNSMQKPIQDEQAHAPPFLHQYVLVTSETEYLSADSAARDDASAALVDQPDADFDASAAEADALMAVDTFCLQDNSQSNYHVQRYSKLLLQKAQSICIYAESSIDAQL